jgi:hypothetical protein
MAEAALISAGVSATTAATAVAVTQYAIVLYGLYSGYKQHQKAKRAYNASLEDRTVTFDATAPARTIVYGENVVGGRVAYAIEPRDQAEEIDGILRPANDKYYLVLALTPDHEVDGFVDILFDGQPAGPWAGDLNNSASTGVYVNSDSKFYKSAQDSVASVASLVPADGRIPAPGLVSLQTLEISMTGAAPSPMSVGDVPAYTVQDPIPRPNFRVEAGAIQLLDEAGNPSGELGGRGYVLHYLANAGGPLVRAWCTHGTDTQVANPVVMERSGGEWTSKCRLRGIPTVTLEFSPDINLLGVLPQVSVIVRGKRCRVPSVPTTENDNRVYTRLSGWAVYDYLRSEYPLTIDDMDVPLAFAAASACGETVSAPYYDASGAVNVTEPRYCCDVVLSTDASRNENLQLLLASMAGSCAWSAGKMRIRAGVAQAASKAFDDSDIVGRIVTTPEASIQQSMNCVRGRFMQKRVIQESEKAADGTRKERQRVAYIPTDFAPYKSTAYVAEDGGEEDWMEIDLPGVTSPSQAQRIALLLLRQARNAFSFETTCGAAMARASAGEVCYWTIEAHGIVNKPFHLMKREKQPDGTYKALWTESTPAIFEPSYLEIAGVDPSPNTRLTPAGVVTMLRNLQVVSGPQYAGYGQDGSLQAYAHVSWDPSDNPGVTYGGWIEIRYKWGDSLDWIVVPPLPGDAVAHDIPITRNRQIMVQARQINGAQIAGAWATASHYAKDAPTQALAGNWLSNPEFVTPSTLDTYELARDWHLIGIDSGDIDYAGPDPDLSPYFRGEPTEGKDVAAHVARVDTYVPWEVRFNIKPGYGAPVRPGDRVQAFCNVHGSGGVTAYVELVFYTASWDGAYATNSVASFEGSEGFSWPAVETPTLDDFKLLGLFAVAPADARYVSMYLTFIRPASVTPVRVRINRPYLGPASPGQISFSNWTK